MCIEVLVKYNYARSKFDIDIVVVKTNTATDPKTLAKAASNGCIGTSEADGWRIYFFAPTGTKVLIRYDSPDDR